MKPFEGDVKKIAGRPHMYMNGRWRTAAMVGETEVPREYDTNKNDASISKATDLLIDLEDASTDTNSLRALTAAVKFLLDRYIVEP